jgi:hypothetical protein
MAARVPHEKDVLPRSKLRKRPDLLVTSNRVYREERLTEMRFGMQFYPLPAAPQTVAYAQRAMSQHRFERLWVPDHLTHENPFVTLAAILAETHNMRPENDVWRAWASRH